MLFVLDSELLISFCMRVGGDGGCGGEGEAGDGLVRVYFYLLLALSSI